jgi:TfoX/Sxy family transcriptional regulator of competence genes
MKVRVKDMSMYEREKVKERNGNVRVREMVGGVGFGGFI